jgi:xylitol oxidase
MSERLTNWAGNVTFSAERVHRPQSLDELQRLVAGSRQVRALGTGHSFNRLADTPGDLVSLAALPPVMDVDTTRMTVTVAAGVRYGELATRLHAAGYALRNLGSLPHISVAGACATGTHGSGNGNGNLATAVSAMDLVTAAGDIVSVSREADGDRFAGTVVSLGALGIVSSLTLDIVPTFDVEQRVYENLPRDQLDAEVFASAYSVSLFTDWSSSRINQVWRKSLTDQSGPSAQPSWRGATPADGPRHPIPGMSTVNCTEQLGVPGPWHTRLPHFRLEFTPSSGEELQTEYFVPRHLAVEALAVIDGIRDRIVPVLQISEIRTIAADDLWLSPSYHRDSASIHFTWVKDTAAVTPVLAAIEDRLAPFGARPHWGKLFGTDPEVLSGQYDRFGDFLQLMRDYDPTGKFRNDLIDRVFPR